MTTPGITRASTICSAWNETSRPNAYGVGVKTDRSSRPKTATAIATPRQCEASMMNAHPIGPPNSTSSSYFFFAIGAAGLARRPRAAGSAQTRRCCCEVSSRATWQSCRFARVQPELGRSFGYLEPPRS